MTVFLLQHSRSETKDAGEDVKVIGIYSSEQSAKDAIARLSGRPGFSEGNGEFHIDEYELDKDNWVEGFVTVT